MSIPTAHAVEQFLANLRTRSAPATTIKAYRLDLQQFVRTVPPMLEEITTDVSRAFLESQGISNPRLAVGTRRACELGTRGSSSRRWSQKPQWIAWLPLNKLNGCPDRWLQKW